MGDWDLRIVDFWDQTKGAINQCVLRLRTLNDSDRAAACDEIREVVRRRANNLPDQHLLQAAVSMVDDLYKYVNDEVLMELPLFEYLMAFGRASTSVVRERGYVIRYVVDNQFSGVDFLMLGPFDVFAKVFNAAGFVYICPQQFGLKLMQGDGLAASEYETAIARYTAEARVVADSLVSKYQHDGLHYVFLEADYQEGALDLALQGAGAPGVLRIFRNEAPVPGSRIDGGH